jgi:hypothetical protein
MQAPGAHQKTANVFKDAAHAGLRDYADLAANILENLLQTSSVGDSRLWDKTPPAELKLPRYFEHNSPLSFRFIAWCAKMFARSKHRWLWNANAGKFRVGSPIYMPWVFYLCSQICLLGGMDETQYESGPWHGCNELDISVSQNQLAWLVDAWAELAGM